MKGFINFFALIMLGLVFSIFLGIDGGNEEVDKADKADKAYAVGDGGVGYIVHTSFISFEEESYNEMMSYLANDNKQAIQGMLGSGRAIILDEGQKVNVVNFGYVKSFVEVSSHGVRGYVPTDAIKDKKADDM
jgi:hypothetical protein